jgi:hypothetical protein
MEPDMDDPQEATAGCEAAPLPTAHIQQAKEMFQNNPILFMCSDANKSNRKRKNSSVENADEETNFTDCLTWLTEVGDTLLSCFNYNGNNFTACTCFSALDLESCARFMVNYALQPKKNSANCSSPSGPLSKCSMQRGRRRDRKELCYLSHTFWEF